LNGGESLNKYKEALANSMQNSANSEVSKNEIPSFTTGRIIGTSGEKYIVETRGGQYTIPSVNGATFLTNKTVWICQPHGSTDVSEQFIIGGKVDSGTIIGKVDSVNGKTGIVNIDKTDIGLGNVDNAKQATKTEFDNHANNAGIHVSPTKEALWNTVSDKADKTSVLTPVPENAVFTDTVYTHPLTHPATMIVEDENHRFVTDAEKNTWDNSNHTHNNLSLLQTITQALVDGWNSAVTHISDVVKHITSAERTLWNTVSNKVDKVTGKGLSTEDYTSAEKVKLTGIAENANNYVHPSTHPSTMITGLDIYATIEYVDNTIGGGGSSDGALIFNKITNQIGVKTIESVVGSSYITQAKQSSSNLLLADKTESKVSDSYVTVIRVYESDGTTIKQTFTKTESKNGSNYETIVT